MAHGLEIRPLLLDHELVEFVYSLPEKFKLTKSYPKKLFVDSVFDLIPDELKQRRKMGFEMPFDKWMQGDLKYHLLNLFGSDNAKNLLSSKYRMHIIKKLEQNKPNRIFWAIGILLEWMDQNDIYLAPKTNYASN